MGYKLSPLLFSLVLYMCARPLLGTVGMGHSWIITFWQLISLHLPLPTLKGGKGHTTASCF